MGRIIILAIALILITPAISHASSKVSVDMKVDEDNVSGKLRINGKKYTLDSISNDINIKTESNSGSGSSSVSVKSSVQGGKTVITESSNVDLSIEHDAGPAPDPDSTIKVTVDGEDIYTVKDIGPGEEVDITYSSSTAEEDITNTEESTSATESSEQDESIEEIESHSFIDSVMDLLDSIATFFQNLF